MLYPGDPAPMFKADSNVNPNFTFDTIAGRYVVLSLFGAARRPFATQLLREVQRNHARFDVTNLMFFGVTVDPFDRESIRVTGNGIILFWDTDLAISRLYGALPSVDSLESQSVDYSPRTIVCDQMLRIVAIIPQAGDAAEHVAQIFAAVDALPKLDELDVPAPVICVPNVFEPELCRELIKYYEDHGGKDSGFMRDVGGKTMPIYDYAHKRRADCEIADPILIRATQQRLHRRVVPAIKQAFQFSVSRIERHIVACYDAADGGHFRAHRDNTTLGTAHRRFAVTMNLNADDFEGGELWFPEFSRRKYRAPTGGAIVFSCSLLHEASPVTKGRRYAFLPFLYDEAAAKSRTENRQFVATAV